MGHNIIRRSRIVEAVKRAVQLGGTREEACRTVGQTFGLDTQTVAWCVGEEEAQEQEAGDGSQATTV